MQSNPALDQHNKEIHKNLEAWNKKPLLKGVYASFYQQMIPHLQKHQTRDTVTLELGSGIGNIKDVIPNCIKTDIFPNPWIDQQEDAYQLSFQNGSVDNIILFDVFHHLRYPGSSLAELHRVLSARGRVIICEPCMSLLGLLVYGVLHHENLGLYDDIDFYAPKNWNPKQDSYYAAQGNATRIFFSKKYAEQLNNWNIKVKSKSSAISYVASGGYSMPQLFPTKLFGLLKKVEHVLDFMPYIFATRLLVVLEKK